MFGKIPRRKSAGSKVFHPAIAQTSVARVVAWQILAQLEREESRHAIRGLPQIALQGNRTPKTKIWQIRLLVRALKPHDYASLTLFWQRASAFLFEHGGSVLKRRLKVRQ